MTFTPSSFEPTFHSEFIISLKTVGKQIMPQRAQAPTTAIVLRSDVNADHDGTVFLNCFRISLTAFDVSKFILAFLNFKFS